MRSAPGYLIGQSFDIRRSKLEKWHAWEYFLILRGNQLHLFVDERRCGLHALWGKVGQPNSHETSLHHWEIAMEMSGTSLLAVNRWISTQTKKGLERANMTLLKYAICYFRPKVSAKVTHIWWLKERKNERSLSLSLSIYTMHQNDIL